MRQLVLLLAIVWLSCGAVRGEDGKAHVPHGVPPGASLGDDSNIAFQTQLVLIEGHAMAGAALFAQGEAEMAANHVHHPIDEIYGAIEDRLTELGDRGFKEDIAALAGAIDKGAASSAVMEQEKALAAALGKRRRFENPADVLRMADVVLQIVKLEYSEGVKDGAVIEDYDYQDAWGFVQALRRILGAVPPASQGALAVRWKEVDDALADLAPLWPDLAGRKPVAAKADAIDRALTVIETALAQKN